MTLLLSFGFILLAFVVTLPTAKAAGVGRIVAFLVLSLLGAAAALLLVHHDVVPTFGEEESSQAEEQTLADMEQALEDEIGLALLSGPDAEALNAHHPTVWHFEQDLTLLCAARDFPASKTLDCWAPDGTIGADAPVDEEDLG